jgi:hypothetical protein
MKVRMSKSQMKKIHITFFDIKGTVHFDFIPQDQTVSHAYYVEILKRLREAVRRKRPGLCPQQLGFDSRRGLGTFLFTTASRTALGPSQPPIQWVGVMRPGREADHSPPSGAEIKEYVELYLHSPIRLHGVVLRDNFTFYLYYDHAPAHKALSVKQFLAQKSITEMEHPPYSPDLAPNDFWLFPIIKSALK